MFPISGFSQLHVGDTRCTSISGKLLLRSRYLQLTSVGEGTVSVRTVSSTVLSSRSGDRRVAFPNRSFLGMIASTPILYRTILWYVNTSHLNLARPLQHPRAAYSNSMTVPTAPSEVLLCRTRLSADPIIFIPGFHNLSCLWDIFASLSSTRDFSQPRV